MIEYGTCRTDGCQNSSIPVAFTRVGDVNVTCGPCGQQVVDITDNPPEPVMEMPTWD